MSHGVCYFPETAVDVCRFSDRWIFGWLIDHEGPLGQGGQMDRK